MEPETCSSCEGAGWVQWEESTDRTKYPCPNCQAGKDFAFNQTYEANARRRGQYDGGVE